jgi:lysophospholipase L1-like esterase
MMKVLIALISLVLFFEDNPDPLRFQDEVNTYKQADKANPPPEGCYLFIGSSSMRMWKSLKEDFKDYPVINRGFGGSHFSDAIYYFDDLFNAYNPEKIIIYEGDNDIAGNKRPNKIMKDLKELLGMIRDNLDHPEIAVISAKPSPRRWDLKDKYENLNARFKKLASKDQDLTYIDVYTYMLNENGRPEPELYLEDSLHMTAKGYEIWKEQIRPFIEK